MALRGDVPADGSGDFSIGVEEEFFLVDAATGALRPRAEQVIGLAQERLGEQVSFELQLAQVETGTVICTSLAQIRAEVTRLRSALMGMAQEFESHILPAGTHPFSDWVGQQVTPRARYAELDESFQQLVWEQLICGCHVHVGVTDPELAIAVMDLTRSWLPALRALTSNSPFWRGVDTGYASYRTMLYDRWPTAGHSPRLGSRQAYDDLVDALVRTDTVTDASKIYWDIRPSSRYSTVEFRVADVLPTIDEVVMLTGLCRSLTRVAVADHRAGREAPNPAPEVLAAARWRAARYGISGTLIDVRRTCAVPATDAIRDLLAILRDDLDEHGEWDEINEITQRVLRHGTGATRQRSVLADGGNHRAVVEHLVAGTLSAGA